MQLSLWMLVINLVYSFTEMDRPGYSKK